MPLWVLEVCFVNAPPVIQAFPWERHALVWLPGPGWSPALLGNPYRRRTGEMDI